MEAAATRHADKIETSSVNQKGRRATLTLHQSVFDHIATVAANSEDGICPKIVMIERIAASSSGPSSPRKEVNAEPDPGGPAITHWKTRQGVLLWAAVKPHLSWSPPMVEISPLPEQGHRLSANSRLAKVLRDPNRAVNLSIFRDHPSGYAVTQVDPYAIRSAVGNVYALPCAEKYGVSAPHRRKRLVDNRLMFTSMHIATAVELRDIEAVPNDVHRQSHHEPLLSSPLLPVCSRSLGLAARIARSSASGPIELRARYCRKMVLPVRLAARATDPDAFALRGRSLVPHPFADHLALELRKKWSAIEGANLSLTHRDSRSL